MQTNDPAISAAAIAATVAAAVATNALQADEVNLSDVPVTLNDSGPPLPSTRPPSWPIDEIDKAPPPPLPTSSPPLTPDKTSDYPSNPSLFTFSTPVTAAPSKLTVAHKPPHIDAYTQHAPMPAQPRRAKKGPASSQYDRRLSIDPDQKVKLEKLEWVSIDKYNTSLI